MAFASSFFDAPSEMRVLIKVIKGFIKNIKRKNPILFFTLIFVLLSCNCRTRQKQLSSDSTELKSAAFVQDSIKAANTKKHVESIFATRQSLSDRYQQLWPDSTKLNSSGIVPDSLNAAFLYDQVDSLFTPIRSGIVDEFLSGDYSVDLDTIRNFIRKENASINLVTKAGSLPYYNISYQNPDPFSPRVRINILNTVKLITAKGMLFEQAGKYDSAWFCYNTVLNVGRHFDIQTPIQLMGKMLETIIVSLALKQIIPLIDDIPDTNTELFNQIDNRLTEYKKHRKPFEPMVNNELFLRTKMFLTMIKDSCDGPPGAHFKLNNERWTKSTFDPFFYNELKTLMLKSISYYSDWLLPKFQNNDKSISQNNRFRVIPMILYKTGILFSFSERTSLMRSLVVTNLMASFISPPFSLKYNESIFQTDVLLSIGVIASRIKTHQIQDFRTITFSDPFHYFRSLKVTETDSTFSIFSYGPDRRYDNEPPTIKFDLSEKNQRKNFGYTFSRL